VFEVSLVLTKTTFLIWLGGQCSSLLSRSPLLRLLVLFQQLFTTGCTTGTFRQSFHHFSNSFGRQIRMCRLCYDKPTVNQSNQCCWHSSSSGKNEGLCSENFFSMVKQKTHSSKQPRTEYKLPSGPLQEWTTKDVKRFLQHWRNGKYHKLFPLSRVGGKDLAGFTEEHFIMIAGSPIDGIALFNDLQALRKGKLLFLHTLVPLATLATLSSLVTISSISIIHLTVDLDCSRFVNISSAIVQHWCRCLRHSFSLSHLHSHSHSHSHHLLLILVSNF